jgi:hypothetical protein
MQDMSATSEVVTRELEGRDYPALKPGKIRQIISEGTQSADDTCGVWCRPIHCLIKEAPIDRDNLHGHVDQIRLEANQLLHRLLNTSAKAKLTGRGRPAIAAALLYIAARSVDLPLSQLEIGAALNLTEPTVRRNYHDIAKALGLDPIHWWQPFQ